MNGEPSNPICLSVSANNAIKDILTSPSSSSSSDSDSLSLSSMASIYACNKCNTNLNLHSVHLFPTNFYFEAGNKNTLSFSSIDTTKLQFEKENKLLPFFETVNYWGLHRNRTKILCSSCASLIGHVYDDGPPLTESTGQFHMGPSQVIPRAPRYRFKIKSLRISTET